MLTAERLEQVGEALAESALDVVLLDLRFGTHDGRELLARLKRERPEVEVIVVTGHASVESAVDCMRAGAFDYLEKPFPDATARAPHRAARDRAAPTGVAQPRARARARGARRPAPTLVGSSPAMRTLAAHAREPAPQREHGADHGRERHRQGADRGRAPRGEPAAGRAPSCRWTAARCPSRSSRASCSGTSAAPSPAPSARPACSGSRTAGRCSWTRSARSRSRSRPSCCARSRPARCARSGAAPRCRSTSA